MVIAQGLAKTFRDPKKGEIRAVEDVSFQAHPGRVFGLLGVNGAGKTTCLRILATIIAPTRGRASVGGYDTTTNPEEVRRCLGFLSASTALYGRLNGRETLEYFGGLYGLTGPALKARIEFVADKLRLEPFLDQLCDKMSTGQKQRVSIARAILHDPPVIFFDEPTVGLDVVTAQTVLEFIEDARTSGKTVVFSTHIMSEVERLCDEVAVIHDGRIHGDGSVRELLAQTAEPTLERAFLKLVGYERRTEVA